MHIYKKQFVIVLLIFLFWLLILVKNILYMRHCYKEKILVNLPLR